jgi:hypothetical protein
MELKIAPGDYQRCVLSWHDIAAGTTKCRHPMRPGVICSERACELPKHPLSIRELRKDERVTMFGVAPKPARRRRGQR